MMTKPRSGVTIEVKAQYLFLFPAFLDDMRIKSRANISWLEKLRVNSTHNIFILCMIMTCRIEIYICCMT